MAIIQNKNLAGLGRRFVPAALDATWLSVGLVCGVIIACVVLLAAGIAAAIIAEHLAPITYSQGVGGRAARPRTQHAVRVGVPQLPRHPVRQAPAGRAPLSGTPGGGALEGCAGCRHRGQHLSAAAQSIENVSDKVHDESTQVRPVHARNGQVHVQLHRSHERGLSVPERVHATDDPARRPAPTRSRLHPRRRLHGGQRRHEPLRAGLPGGAGRGRRHHQLPAGRTGLPLHQHVGRTGQRGAQRPGAGAALGARQHPRLRRRPGQRHPLRRVGRRSIRRLPHAVAHVERTVPPRDPFEQHCAEPVRADRARGPGALLVPPGPAVRRRQRHGGRPRAAAQLPAPQRVAHAHRRPAGRRAGGAGRSQHPWSGALRARHRVPVPRRGGLPRQAPRPAGAGGQLRPGARHPRLQQQGGLHLLHGRDQASHRGGLPQRRRGHDVHHPRRAVRPHVPRAEDRAGREDPPALLPWRPRQRGVVRLSGRPVRGPAAAARHPRHGPVDVSLLGRGEPAVHLPLHARGKERPVLLLLDEEPERRGPRGGAELCLQAPPVQEHARAQADGPRAGGARAHDQDAGQLHQDRAPHAGQRERQRRRRRGDVAAGAEARHAVPRDRRAAHRQEGSPQRAHVLLGPRVPRCAGHAPLRLLLARPEDAVDLFYRYCLMEGFP